MSDRFPALAALERLVSRPSIVFVTEPFIFSPCLLYVVRAERPFLRWVLRGAIKAAYRLVSMSRTRAAPRCPPAAVSWDQSRILADTSQPIY